METYLTDMLREKKFKPEIQEEVELYKEVFALTTGKKIECTKDYIYDLILFVQFILVG